MLRMVEVVSASETRKEEKEVRARVRMGGGTVNPPEDLSCWSHGFTWSRATESFCSGVTLGGQ